MNHIFYRLLFKNFIILTTVLKDQTLLTLAFGWQNFKLLNSSPFYFSVVSSVCSFTMIHSEKEVNGN